MKRVILCLLCLISMVASAPTYAASCSFETRGAAALDDFDVLRTLRCLVNAVDRLESENAALKRRLEEVESVMTELPAEYSNIDGEVTREDGRAVGTARFLLSARSTGGANALPIDQAVLEEVCSASGGCSVSLEFRELSLFDSETKGSLLVGPCRFTYTAGKGDWSLGEGCGNSASSGKDGDQFATTDPDVASIIFSSSGGCLFAESEPSRGGAQGDTFIRDHRLGLFLVAMPSLQPNGIRRFQCELVLN